MVAVLLQDDHMSRFLTIKVLMKPYTRSEHCHIPIIGAVKLGLVCPIAYPW